MLFRPVLAFMAIALPLLLGGTAFATEAEIKKEQLRTGSILTTRTKEETLASCMALWDPSTHMTKDLWRTVCKRLETKN